MKALISILNAHSVETKSSAGNLLALDIYTTPDGTVCREWLNVTEMTTLQIYTWLGY